MSTSLRDTGRIREIDFLKKRPNLDENREGEKQRRFWLLFLLMSLLYNKLSLMKKLFRCKNQESSKKGVFARFLHLLDGFIAVSGLSQEY